MAATTGVQPVMSVSQIIDNVWLYVKNQINIGNVNKIRIPNNFKLTIGQQGIDVLASRFRYAQSSIYS